MAGNLLPLVLVGGAALMFAGGKKKRRKGAASKGNVFYTDDDKDLVALAKNQMGARGVGIGVPNTPQRSAVIKTFKAAAAQHKDLIFVISRGNLVPPSVKKDGNAAILVAGGIGGDGIIDYEDSVMVKSAADLRAQLGRFINIARSKMPKVISPGASGAKAGVAKTKERQEILHKLDYDPGKVDGKYGPKTKAAIMEFQSDANITVDGKWGPQTGAAALQALAMAAKGLGKAAFGQIGKMLGKFQETLAKLFEREGVSPSVADEGRFSEAGAQERKTSVHAIDASRSYWARGKIKVNGVWSEWHGIRGAGERRPIEWEPPLYGTYPTEAMANAAADAWKSGRGGHLSSQIAKAGWG